ncbi:MAG: hypothetical protein M1414_06980 [Candidatus Thermoplasmatota archaeon]|jgi:hypothetical protein|nr:hypothetical protein [Candidatus Thermoplasmatota archaeon]MCL5988624.1 hypothetical protein [Candidatus Thermoplasmatota archaeon]
MNPLYDLYVIESALLSGEVDDAVKLIEKKCNIYKNPASGKNGEKIRKHVKVMEAVMESLKNSIGIEEFMKIMNDNYSYSTEDGNSEKFIQSFSYMVFYSIDRYNIHYPAYDGKRCGDL